MAKKHVQAATPAAEMAEGYPSYRYQQGTDRRLVRTLEEDEALGAGWFNSPKRAAAAVAGDINPIEGTE